MVAWRKSPPFLLDEVTITRLGEISPSLVPTVLCVRVSGKLTDEAEILVAMASDWLQLDATDDWIRRDSGTVSSFSGLLTARTSRTCRAFGMSCPKKVTVEGRSPSPG